jgi:hypothetical protein
MASVRDTAREFVRAYYTYVVQTPDDLHKFYDTDKATIWRDQLGANPGVAFDRALLAPEIGQGSRVAVTRYNVLPGQSGFSVAVYGSITFAGVARLFHQFLTLSDVEGRFSVVSDCLSSCQTQENPDGDDADLIAVPLNQPAQPPASNRQQPPDRQPVKAKRAGSPNRPSTSSTGGRHRE